MGYGLVLIVRSGGVIFIYETIFVSVDDFVGVEC